MEKNMKYIFISIIIATLLGAKAVKQNKLNYSKLDKIPAKELTRYLANEISKNLPIQLDYLTQVSRVLAYKNKITTNKKVDFNHPDYQKAWNNSKEHLIEITIKQDTEVLCYDPFNNYLLTKKDVIFIYKITNKNNKPLYEYTITKEDCRKLK